MRSTFAEIAAANAFGAPSTTDPGSAFAASTLPWRSDESVLGEACPSWSLRRPQRVASVAASAVGDDEPWAFTVPKQHGRDTFTLPAQRGPHYAFTLAELLVVTAIIGSLMVLVAPAFTSIKSAGDVTSAAYTIRDALEQARNYAMANNTYVWIGFFEEDGSVPSATPTATPGIGRLVISIAASKDGTTVYNANSSSNPDPMDPTRLVQVTTLVKIENLHLPLFAIGSGTGDTFDLRPTLQFDPGGVGYNDSRFGEINLSGNQSAPTTNSRFPFQYPVGSPAPAAQYTFRKTLQFNPRGECNINSTYKMRRVVEIGLQPTHGNITDPNIRNVVAIQFSGVGGNFKIYRR
jgi:prepilin-type N-terminal cleavage/methylation domain-containing protein